MKRYFNIQLNTVVGLFFEKYEFWQYIYMNYPQIMLTKGRVNNELWSSTLVPDQVLLTKICNIININIIEDKYQQGAGSVDEKLQTCVYKLWEYQRLFTQIDNNINVNLCYLLNNFFNDKKYRDTKVFMRNNGVSYFIIGQDDNELKRYFVKQLVHSRFE